MMELLWGIATARQALEAEEADGELSLHSPDPPTCPRPRFSTQSTRRGRQGHRFPVGRKKVVDMSPHQLAGPWLDRHNVAKIRCRAVIMVVQQQLTLIT